MDNRTSSGSSGVGGGGMMKGKNGNAAPVYKSNYKRTNVKGSMMGPDEDDDEDDDDSIEEDDDSMLNRDLHRKDDHDDELSLGSDPADDNTKFAQSKRQTGGTNGYTKNDAKSTKIRIIIFL